MLREDRPADAVTAGVGQLKPDQQVAGLSPALGVRLPAKVHHLRQTRGVGLVDDELTGVGAPFGDDGGGLAPDQLGPALAEAPVAAEGQVARSAVEGAVAAFHRLDRHAVADGPVRDIRRFEQGGQVIGQADVQTASLGVPGEIGGHLVFEVAGQGVVLISKVAPPTGDDWLTGPRFAP